MRSVAVCCVCVLLFFNEVVLVWCAKSRDGGGTSMDPELVAQLKPPKECQK